MMKTANRLFLAAAAASVAVLPIAAQANTRAGDSGSVYSVSAPGLGRSAQGESLESTEGVIIGILAAAAIVGGIVLASESEDDGQSPGT